MFESFDDILIVEVVIVSVEVILCFNVMVLVFLFVDEGMIIVDELDVFVVGMVDVDDDGEVSEVE